MQEVSDEEQRLKTTSCASQCTELGVPLTCVELRLPRYLVAGWSWASQAAGLLQLKGLRELSFGHLSLTPQSVEAIAPVLPELKMLRKLSLAMNNLSGVMALLCSALCELKGLEDLNVSYCKLDVSAAKSLAIVIGELSPSLLSLNLSWSSLSRAALDHLTPALRGLKRLEALDMGGNRLAVTGGMESLAPALREMVSLRTLSLGWNDFERNTASLQHLNDSLLDLTALRTLNLVQGELDDKGNYFCGAGPLDATAMQLLAPALGKLSKELRVNV